MSRQRANALNLDIMLRDRLNLRHTRFEISLLLTVKNALQVNISYDVMRRMPFR
jgi:hypothetical protein